MSRQVASCVDTPSSTYFLPPIVFYFAKRENGLKVSGSRPLSVYWWKTEKQLSNKWKQRRWADQRETRESWRIQTDWLSQLGVLWTNGAKLMYDTEIMSACSFIHISISPKILNEYRYNLVLGGFSRDVFARELKGLERQQTDRE